MIYFFAHIKSVITLLIAKGRYHYDGGKEIAAEYFIANKGFLRENAKTKYRKLSEEKKEVKGEYENNRSRNITEDEKAT